MLFVTCEKKNSLRWSGRPRTGLMYPSRAILASSLWCWKIFDVVGYQRNTFNDENFPIYVQKFWALASRGKWKTNPGLLDWATSGLPGRNNDHRYLVFPPHPRKNLKWNPGEVWWTPHRYIERWAYMSIDSIHFDLWPFLKQLQFR